MLSDPESRVQAGWRVVYDDRRYVIRRVNRDANGYAELEGADWPETPTFA